ncbi:MAG: hypothetical protein GY714_10985 [Desulfobacterales bacterium]|nr:hypothetical protein [Desulfobacterales bacterium]MCP4161283.1 hypothetical protein [Deltaproteobacteria bacterium]
MKRYDKLKSYCRMLGHEIPFEYCRSNNNNLPCRKILDCWFERFDIKSYLSENFSDSEKEQIFKPQPDKVSTIFDLIEKAKNRTKKE